MGGTWPRVSQGWFEKITTYRTVSQFLMTNTQTGTSHTTHFQIDFGEVPEGQKPKMGCMGGTSSVNFRCFWTFPESVGVKSRFVMPCVFASKMVQPMTLYKLL